MEDRIIDQSYIQEFAEFLIREERSTATQDKYLRDIHTFLSFMGNLPITRERVAQWKKRLIEQGYAVRSVNSMLASVNSFLSFLGWQDCKVKNLKLQKETYCAEQKELTKSEYLRLLEASKNNVQLSLILQTICGTGIRISELCFFTVEAVKKGDVIVNCKNKIRTILIPKQLRKMLLSYAQKRHILKGTIFVGKNGKPIDRSSIWRQMKRLCKSAGVKESKVFPHNLRKLFARTFYNIEKDIAKLADIMGHSSINTTRIYIISTGAEHRRKIEQLGLILR